MVSRWSLPSTWTTLPPRPSSSDQALDVLDISVRVLWLQREVKLGMVVPSTVSTRDNTADLGTKRLSRDRMRYLMNLCKVYDLSQSENVGKDVLEKLHQSEAMSEGEFFFLAPWVFQWTRWELRPLRMAMASSPVPRSASTSRSCALLLASPSSLGLSMM